MRSQLLKAFAYYRGRCVEQAIVFHHLDEYFICTDDNNVINHPTFQILKHGFNLENDNLCAVVVIGSNDVKNVLASLFEQGFSIRTIEYKNSQNESEIPNIDEILREQELDY